MLKKLAERIITEKLDSFYIHVLVLICRIIIGVVFILASISKIGAPDLFAQTVQTYHILPFLIVPAFSYILPWMEFFMGIYLIIGLFTKYTAYLTLFLLIIFIIAISYALLTNQPVQGCGCFSSGATAEIISWWDVVRDFVFIALTLPICFSKKSIFAIDNILKTK